MLCSRRSSRAAVRIFERAEVMMHVAIYAGVPAANHAFKIAKQTLKEMAAEKAA